MQVKPVSYKHEPGVSLALVPDTDVERELLRMMWAHGRMEVGNGVADGSEQGFFINARPERT